jgi:glycosyltransferase involved in cell wall biosynthesis
VIDGQTGLLFRYGDVVDLADKLTRLLSGQENRNRLVKGGLEWAKNFSWDQSAAKVGQLIERVISEGRK